MYKKIVVAVDGSESSWRAFDAALWLAKQCGGELHAVTVEEAPARTATRQDGASMELEAEGMRLSGDIVMTARRRGMEAGVEVYAKVIDGHEVRSVLAYAEKHKMELLVVGRKGCSQNYADVPGSTATMLMLRATCPFLAVP